eukprot:gene21651-28664_t
MGGYLPAVNLGNGRTPTAIAVGKGHTCALLDNGALKCWGKNSDGQLGMGDIEPCADMGDAHPAVDLGTGRTATAITAGGYHTCALLDNRDLKCWGANNYGQLGLGISEYADMGDGLPVVDLGTGRTATAIAAGEYHTCAILDNSQLKCWGSNIAGELGLGSTASRVYAVGDLPSIDLGTNRTATAIAAGMYHTCAILDTGALKCWGFNKFGQLGLGDSSSRGVYVEEMGNKLPVVDLGTNRTATAITTRGQHCCALLDNNAVKCWGGNNNWQLGLGDTVSRGDAPYGSGPMPTITTTTRVVNEEFVFIPTEIVLTVSAEVCFAIGDNPNPFTLAFQDQVASDWNTANPSAPIKNGDVEVISVNTDCGIRRSHRSLLQPRSRASTMSMLVSSFASNFGVEGATVTSSTHATVVLTVSADACAAIDVNPTPFNLDFLGQVATDWSTSDSPTLFTLALQDQVASDWNTANPGVPIRISDVEVISVTADCSFFAVFGSSVTTLININLPTGVQASASMIDSFKQASTVGMMDSSFASNFGVNDVLVTTSPPVPGEMPAEFPPPPSPPPASNPDGEGGEGSDYGFEYDFGGWSSDDDFTLAIALASVATGITVIHGRCAYRY